MKRLGRLRALRDDDQGVTMIELLMYSLLLGLVISLVGSILISSMFAERTVREVISATTKAQLAADSISTGIRNSSAYDVVAVGGDQMLRARVARGVVGSNQVTWKCAAWYYSATLKTISFKESATAIAAPGSTTVLKTWTVLADGVSPSSGSTIFTDTTPTLAIAFRTAAGDDPPGSIKTSAVSRSEAWKSDICF